MFVYVLTTQVWTSVTVMTTPTLVSPPAKVQKAPLALQPFKTLTITSMLAGSKNVK